jgi:hypothetical protein
MYGTTGFTRGEITGICEMISPAAEEPRTNRWPPVLGLFRSVVVTLTYLRRNRVQAEIAETFGVSQPTISRAISAMTPLIAEILAYYVPAADDLDDSSQYIVDGALLPYWS